MMDPTVISAILALVGSLVGTFGGIIASSKLTEYRIKELEKKQDKHNQVIERTYKLEERMELVEERQKVANHRIAHKSRKDHGTDSYSYDRRWLHCRLSGLADSWFNGSGGGNFVAAYISGRPAGNQRK